MNIVIAYTVFSLTVIAISIALIKNPGAIDAKLD